MKRFPLLLALSSFLLLASSCAIFNKNKDTSLYSKPNREKVKVKKSLLSFKGILATKKGVTFGGLNTTSIEDGVGDSHIKTFPTQDHPFHFFLNQDEVNKVKVQAVYTDEKSFPNTLLPVSFSNTSSTKIFYAKIDEIGANDFGSWKLILKNPTYEEMAQKSIIGILRAQNTDISLIANNRSGGIQSYDELTFEFQLDGRPIAAVQVGGKRKYVWILPGIDENVRYVVAGAAAAILLK